jgi:capsular exopolysaccharide synthesis family protein
VVALSADLRRPSLAEFFGMDDSGPGLTSVLVGDTSLHQALLTLPGADASGLEVLPAGPSPHNPADLLGSQHMDELMQSLVASGADYVLVDCPPVLPVSDTLALVQHVDGVIVVCVPGQTKTDNLTTALHRLEQVGSEIIGVVLNGVSATKGRYGHYYRYEYAPANADAPRRVRTDKVNGSSTEDPFTRGANAIVADEAAKNG